MGSEDPRKKLGTLLEALALLKQRGLAVRLLKVGASGHPKYRRALTEQVASLGVEDLVTIVGEVADTDLPLFYSAADAFTLPSDVEGFGLPALEAMACGTPVVWSDAGALPEVAGDAAVMVPVGDAEALAAATANILRDCTLRERLVERGLHRCRQFTWAATAQHTRAVYDALQQRGG